MKELIEAYWLAKRLHEGQVDKKGVPYITHLVRVSVRMNTDVGMIAAILHDSVEDGFTTFDKLREFGVPEEALAAIDAVTRRPGESYPDFILRAKKDPLGRLVKIADLEDNLLPWRNANPTVTDSVRATKYRLALAILKGDLQ